MSTLTKLGQGEQNAGRSLGKTIFFYAIILAGIALTFMFGYNYVGSAVGNAVVGGLFSLLLFDVGAIGWSNIRRNRGLSSNQQSTANVMMWFSAVSAVVVSVIQLVLGSSLITVEASTTQAVGQFGVWLLGIVGAAHFLAYFFFNQHDYDVQMEEAEEELDRSLKENRLAMLKKVRSATIAETNAILMGDIQPLAEKEAATIRREFLQEFNQPLVATSATTHYPLPTKEAAAAGAMEATEAVPAETAPQAYQTTELPDYEVVDPTCACGLPIGSAEGECTADVCMIDTKAAEQKEARQESKVVFDYSLRTPEEIAQAEAEAKARQAGK